MTLKIGVIGTGAIGQEHIARLHCKLSGSTVVAVNDINLDQARTVGGKLTPPARVHDSGQALIDDPEVEAVVVTSWGPSHEEFVLAAIAAGKPVFCEKPLATTAEACRRIVDAEVASGRHLVQVGFMRRYDAGYRALKRVLDSGEIGEPLIVHCAHRNPDVPAHYTGDMAITDTVVHEIDVLRWLLDDDYVSAQVVLPRRSSKARPGLDDPQIIMLETAKGVRIDVEAFVNCRYGYDIQCEVVAEEGIAKLPEPMSVPLRKSSRASQEILMDWKLRFIDAYDVELQEWIEATTRDEVTGPTAWDGYCTAVASDACVEARHSGQIVKIPVLDRPSFYDESRRARILLQEG